MKTLILLSILAVPFLATGESAKGGSSVGDGGHSIVCPIPDGKINVNLLDVVEAQDRIGLNLLEMPINFEQGTIDDLIQSLDLRFHSTMGEHVLPNTFLRAQTIHNSLQQVPALAVSEDADFMPPGVFGKDCHLAQLGLTLTQSPGEVVMVDQSQWQRLPQAQRALFLVHESLHFDGFDSATSRQLMAFMMASDVFQMRNRAVAQKIIATRALVPWSDFRR